MAKGVDIIVLIRKRWRSGGGGLPDFISFEQETIILVHPAVQREQGAHLPHQGGELLVGGQGETHAILLPLEGVEGVELGEVFL